jgi:hypothetical protein
MLTKITRALNWADEKLEHLLADLAANHARELLAAHGLAEIEIDQVRRNSKVEPVQTEKTDRSAGLNEALPPQTHLAVICAERFVPGVSHRVPKSTCDLWSGPEILAALCVAGAALASLLFCLAAIFKA